MSVALNDRERYQQYLCSREWNVLKEAVKKRSRGICERCLQNPMDHVHHLTYERKYHERLEDLQALCKPCHDFTHGKSDTDPAVPDYPLLWGTKISTVYLAGKITGTTWRREIVPDWGPRLAGGREVGGTTNPQTCFWAPVTEAVFVPVECRHRPAYAGPFWLDLGGGHIPNPGIHAYGTSQPSDHGCYYTNAKRVRNNCLSAITVSELFFAWIDDTNCHGTLVEIGYASRRSNIVVVAFSSTEIRDSLWFAGSMACLHLIAGSAGEAWERLWKDSKEDCMRGDFLQELNPWVYPS